MVICFEPPGTFSSACQGLHATSGVRTPHRARRNKCQDLHFGIIEEHDHVMMEMTLNLRALRSKSASPMSHPSSGKPSLRISCSTALISTWIPYSKIGQKKLNVEELIELSFLPYLICADHLLQQIIRITKCNSLSWSNYRKCRNFGKLDCLNVLNIWTFLSGSIIEILGHLTFWAGLQHAFQ